MIMKSSRGLHFIVTTGNRCRLAKHTHFLSCKLNKVTEWSEATLHMHFCIRIWNIINKIHFFYIQRKYLHYKHRVVREAVWFLQRERKICAATCRRIDPRGIRRNRLRPTPNGCGRNEDEHGVGIVNNLRVRRDRQATDGAANLKK